MGVFEDLILKYVLQEEPRLIIHKWTDERACLDQQAATLAAELMASANPGVPNAPIGFYNWHRYPVFRETVKKHIEIPADGKEGPRLAVLYVHPDAYTCAIHKVCDAIKILGNRPKIILLAEDAVLEKRAKYLEEEGFDFLFGDWQQPHSQYRGMLAVAEKNGKVYEMVRQGMHWGFAEKPLLDELREKYRATASAPQPGQQLDLFHKGELVVRLKGPG